MVFVGTNRGGATAKLGGAMAPPNFKKLFYIMYEC